MITSLTQIRVEATELVLQDLVDFRVEIFTTGRTELPVISLTPGEALILSRQLVRAARRAR